MPSEIDLRCNSSCYNAFVPMGNRSGFSSLKSRQSMQRSEDLMCDLDPRYRIILQEKLEPPTPRVNPVSYQEKNLFQNILKERGTLKTRKLIDTRILIKSTPIEVSICQTPEGEKRYFFTHPVCIIELIKDHGFIFKKDGVFCVIRDTELAQKKDPTSFSSSPAVIRRVDQTKAQWIWNKFLSFWKDANVEHIDFSGMC